MIKGLSGATIWSEDLGNPLPFYRDVLGLPVGIQIPGFVVFGNLDAPALALGTHSEVRGRNADPSRHMVGFTTDDVRAAVGAEAERRGTSPHDGGSEGEHHREKDEARATQRAREADSLDEEDERGRDQHATQGCPIESETDGEAPPPLEPGREDDVDGGAAHRPPAQRHEEEGRVELPRLGHPTECRQARGHREASADYDGARAKSPE